MTQLTRRVQRTAAAAVKAITRPLTTPLRPGDYLGLLDPLWNSRVLRGRIDEVRQETADATTLVIRPGLGWRYDYLPGQFISIGLQVDGRFHWRSYSLTSPPERGAGLLTITVKAMPEGFLSQHLAHSTPAGTIVRLAAPSGDFVLPNPPPARVLLLGAGSGITPLMAMVRTMARRAAMTDVVMLTSFPSPASALFRAELLALTQSHPGFTLTEHWSEESGHIDPPAIAAAVPDWAERTTWACGPKALLESCQEWWRHHGHQDELHIERYEPAETAATGEGGTVTFTRSGKSTEIDGATTILEAGESLGIAMPYGCRLGICHTCVVPLESGQVIDIRDGASNDQTSGYIQTCVSAAAGDCEIRI